MVPTILPSMLPMRVTKITYFMLRTCIPSINISCLGCKSEEIVVPDGGIRNNCNSKNPGASAAVRDGPKGIQTKSNPNLVGARYPWQLGSFTGENGLLDANSVGKPYTNSKNICIAMIIGLIRVMGNCLPKYANLL